MANYKWPEDYKGFVEAIVLNPSPKIFHTIVGHFFEESAAALWRITDLLLQDPNCISEVGDLSEFKLAQAEHTRVCYEWKMIGAKSAPYIYLRRSMNALVNGESIENGPVLEVILCRLTSGEHANSVVIQVGWTLSDRRRALSWLQAHRLAIALGLVISPSDFEKVQELRAGWSRDAQIAVVRAWERHQLGSEVFFVVCDNHEHFNNSEVGISR
ncbi:hypothetical protein JNK13_05060 [bacterium]|nr:hypothetical protein [bacterium]